MIAALVDYWATQPNLMASSSDGKLWLDEAPESVSLPYATIELHQDQPYAFTTKFPIYRAIVSIKAHANLAQAASRAITTAVVPGLVLAPLIINGVSVLHVLPDESGIEISPNRGPRGQDAWTASKRFEVLYMGPDYVN